MIFEMIKGRITESGDRLIDTIQTEEWGEKGF